MACIISVEIIIENNYKCTNILKSAKSKNKYCDFLLDGDDPEKLK
jgi:hypothetical protein